MAKPIPYQPLLLRLAHGAIAILALLAFHSRGAADRELVAWR
ncbi:MULTISPECIES: hypothetical protein [unclassified Thermosynechococcus]|nr:MULTISPECIES: hypothetical protein [unclassified Thermosynechococcus]MDR5638281.1 hypothetical protein [Thermosynechococcus sp. PP42]MDR7897091.1 hypothetical protein [Thermosynechococcus sp. JY1332]MDR7904489.1 hypothetical protein [Thermosynechococcus sp. JY1334]MDR7920970.1 hypothetical protein [Thermosynechococcus sp. HY213]MDR7992326.1 hypothetical protein [Thermosynechococcus sp. TG252]